MRGLFLSLALRSLLRNPRRTVITFVIIAISTGAILLLTTAGRAFTDSARDTELRLLTGQGQIHATGYLDDPGIEHSMPAPGKALLAALDHAPVTMWAARVRVPAVIQSEYRSLGVTLLGVDPQKERKISDLPGMIERGHYLRDVSDGTIVLGSHLLQRLKTRVGKRVVVLSQAADGHLAERSFVIVGAYGGAQNFQDQFAFSGLRPVHAMLGMGDRISEISFDAASEKALPDAIANLRRAAQELDVKSWSEVVPLLAAMDQLASSNQATIFVIIFILMAIGIVNAQLMAVFERTREFGLLHALGMKPRLILLQVTLESAILIGLGVLLGIALAWLVVASVHNRVDLGSLAQGVERFGSGRVVHPHLIWSQTIVIGGLIWLLGTGIALWPARRAANTNAIEAMSHV